METGVSYVRLYRDRLIVVLYVIFVVAAIIVYPARTTEVTTAQASFGVCEGGWENPAGAQGLPDELSGIFSTSSTLWNGDTTAITCTSLSTSTIPQDPLEIKLHVAFAKLVSNTSTIQAAGIEETAAISEAEVQSAPPVEEIPIIEETPAIQVEATSTPVAEIVATSTPEVSLPPVQPQQLIAVEYTTDGSVWQSAGYITDTTEGEFIAMIDRATPLEHLQVRLSGIATSTTKIYVDSVCLSIDYRNEAPVLELPVAAEIATSTPAVEQSQAESSVGVSAEKPEQILFEGLESDNPPVIVPVVEEISLDPQATHSCELTQYHMSLGNDIPQTMNVAVLLSNFGVASSTLRVNDVSDGLSLAFENGLPKIAILPDQLSANLTVNITKNIEPRSFNIPIVYSIQKPDGFISHTTCQLNLIVE